MEGGTCRTNAIWDGVVWNKTAEFWLDLNGQCGVRVFFANGEIDEDCPTGKQTRKVEYLLQCDPKADVPVLKEIVEPTNCQFQATVHTVLACPYLPGVKGGGWCVVISSFIGIHS
jgi:hypothetical protein